ncbi:hypothetical protein [Nocardia sp. NPDC003345]
MLSADGTLIIYLTHGADPIPDITTLDAAIAAGDYKHLVVQAQRPPVGSRRRSRRRKRR